ncbi:MAG: glycosyltransferase [Cyanobacteria bacterium RI_101]|nr:glycosyltransferase [Cyanobacteria bacterium RI_101]
MPRFFVVDQSLANYQGHHYECSLAAAEAARRAGYEPVILANRVWSCGAEGDIPILPVFAVDWFNQPVAPSEAVKNPAPEDKTNPSPQLARFQEKVAGSAERLGRWWRKDLELVKRVPFSHTAWGIFKTLWGLIRFILSFLRSFVPVNLPAPEETLTERKPETFGETLKRIFTELAPIPTDQVFIHTIGIEQIEELFWFLQAQSSEALPVFHVLLRRDPQDPLVAQAPGLGIGAIFRECHEWGLWPGKIRFYSDAPKLIQGYNSLGALRVQEIPIPFRQENLDSLGLEPKNLEPDAPIHIVYLGDARTEKGYQLLPELVLNLWEDYLAPKRARFTIQSNYNIGGGEAEAVRAKVKLAQFPSQTVKLLEAPLTAQAYYALLKSADLVVLPYNPQSYQRTSGVLTEALAAGKPVVVPAGSWLAEQVAENRGRIYENPSQLAGAVRSALENLPALTQGAQAYAPLWRQRQSPERLIHILLGPAPQFTPIPQPAPKVFLILPSFQAVHSPDGAVTRQVIQTLGRNGYRLYILFYGADLTPSFGENCWEKAWLIAGEKAELPADLVKLAPRLRPDLILSAAPWGRRVCQQLGWLSAPLAGLFTGFQAEAQALTMGREVDLTLLTQEQKQWGEYSFLLAANPIQSERLGELFPQIPCYPLSKLSSGSGAVSAEFLTQQLNQVLTQNLTQRALPLTPIYPHPRVAVFYPWGDLQERRSGASQRVGHLIDYLREKGLEIGAFSLGGSSPRWQNGVYYADYAPAGDWGNLTQRVYQDAFLSWQKALGLTSALNREDLESAWLPWIYYAFRFDPQFKAWLEEITDWADVVILEYPFWAAILAPICQGKKIPLILTAHDVLAKQLDPQSLLAKIALYEELQALKQASDVVTLSPLDQTFFAEQGVNSHCVPIGLDLAKIEERRRQAPVDLTQTLNLNRDWRKPFCLFIGSAHGPNLRAVEWLKAWSRAPGLTWDFLVVGGCCPPEENGAFFALGKVSEEILVELYRQTALVVIPLESGTGMSVKTLEALAWGKAALGTSIAFRGYPVQSGVHCVVDNSLENYPQTIQRLLDQPEYRQKLEQGAAQFAQAYDYRGLYETYRQLILTSAPGQK